MGIKQIIDGLFNNKETVPENRHAIKVTVNCSVCGLSQEFDTTSSYGRINPVNFYGSGWKTSSEFLDEEDYYFCPLHAETAKIRQEMCDDHEARKATDLIQMEEEWDEANPEPTMQQAIARMKAKEHKGAIDV